MQFQRPAAGEQTDQNEQRRDDFADDDIAAGRLVRVLPGWPSPEMGVYAVYPSRKHLSAKVRTFVDFLADALSA